jgi:type IV pilus assembly protein PilO
MATKPRGRRLPQIDIGELANAAASQFRGIDPAQPGQWPLLPKITAFALTTLVTLGALWVVALSAEAERLQVEQDREPTLRQDFRSKLGQAVNLGELRRQKLQVQEFVTQLERQLPGKAEMDALLSDINQAGLGRGLLFELFRPGQVEVKEYYAELPIAIRVTGRYHDIGAFAADVANLSRIVTLHNLTIGPAAGKDTGAVLAMEATARTYRYIDSNEVAQSRKAAQDKNANGNRK